MCTMCAARATETEAQLRREIANLHTSIDALADALDDAESLCNILAWRMQHLLPDFVDGLDDDERALWEAVAPFGHDDTETEAA